MGHAVELRDDGYPRILMPFGSREKSRQVVGCSDEHKTYSNAWYQTSSVEGSVELSSPAAGARGEAYDGLLYLSE